jgi:uncharacterized Zn finger protein
MVAGSEVYEIKIAIAPVKPTRWKSICRDCAGTVDSLIELLQGRLAKAVMDRVCREGDGLFPSATEIKLSCSCPDWADMCKHVAAVLYGIGARLDENPQLLFVLRGVDENELLASAGQDSPLTRTASEAAKVLDEGDVAALFGLEMAQDAHIPLPTAAPAKQPQRSGKRSKAQKGAPARKTKPAVKNETLRRATVASSETSTTKGASAGRRRRQHSARRQLRSAGAEG